MKSPATTSRARFQLSALTVLVLIVQAITLSGCSTHSALLVEKVEQQTSNQKQIQQVMDALNITEARIAKARADNVELYAPRQMSEAKDALGQARRYSERFQADPDNVNRSISLFFGDTMGEKALALITEANDALDQAEDNKKQADAIFAEANENFIWLKKFKAPMHYRYEYEELEQTQRQLVGYVAENDLEAARQGLPRLLQQQRALEIAAAQTFYLQELIQKISRQERGAVERYAPQSYSASLGALNKAKAVIAENPRAEQNVMQAKADAEFSFAVANAVAADMQSLVTMDHHEMERWLILLEAKLFDLGNSIGAQDVRNHKVLQQLELLTQAAGQKHAPEPQAEEQLAATATDAPAEQASTQTSEQPSQQPSATDASSVPAAEEHVISQRMNQLEHTLSEQIKALSEQLHAMKSANKSAQITPSYQVPEPYQAPKRKALFGN